MPRFEDRHEVEPLRELRGRSVAAVELRPSTSVPATLRRASAIDGSSMSIPSTETSGYARAIEMLDQPQSRASSARVL